jgi:hypothetical protein
VSTGRPVCREASIRISMDLLSPWKAYGLVLGFQTPPRITWAPASFTAAAVSRKIVRVLGVDRALAGDDQEFLAQRDPADA